MNEPLYDREGMANMIRIYFVEQKRRTQPRYRPNPRHDHKENWLRAADVCLELKANPLDFVTAAFTLCPHPGGPFANTLGGPAAKNWYLEYSQKRSHHAEIASDPTSPDILRTILAQEILTEIKLAHMLFYQITGCADPYFAHKVLLDQFTSIHPYVRVAIAGREGLLSIVQKFKEPAEEFFACRPGYVAVLQALGYNVTNYLNGIVDKPSIRNN